MTDENNTILDSGSLNEFEEYHRDFGGDGHEEQTDEYVETDLAATKESDPPKRGMEFYIQMHTHNFDDLETAIIHACATQLIGKYGNNDLAKKIEETALNLVNEKINQKLESVTEEIMDSPMVSVKGGEPITMRDYIGISARDWLQTTVDNEGNPKPRDRWNDHRTRAERAISNVLSKGFRTEMDAATQQIISDLRQKVNAVTEAVKAEQKAKIAAAFERYTK